MCTRSKVYISSTIALISWLYLPVFPSVACGGPMDIVIVLDGSNSIYPWEPMNMFLEKLIPALDIGPQSTQVGLFSLTTFYFYIHFTGRAFLPIYTQFVHPFRSVSFNMGWLPNLNSDRGTTALRTNRCISSSEMKLGILSFLRKSINLSVPQETSSSKASRWLSLYNSWRFKSFVFLVAHFAGESSKHCDKAAIIRTFKMSPQRIR